MSVEEKAIKATYFSIGSNAVLALVKGFSGFFGNSFALIADAIESASDILASILVLLGLKYAKKPADENHPYGHGRIEPLITFIVVGFLIFSAILIAHQAIRNIQTPHEPPAAWTLIVLAVIIVWKELSFQLIRRRSKETGSSSLKADAWHHRSDAITSVAAFIGIAAAIILGEGYETADDWAALLASVFILYNCYHIFRPALGEIMDENLYDDLIRQIRTVAATVDGIAGTEKCYVRKAGMKYLIDLHATVDASLTVREGHDISHRLKDALTRQLPQLGYVIIHIEPHDIGTVD